MAKATKALPAITNYQTLMQTLQSWRKTINNSINRPSAPSVPRNFQGTQARGGVSLTWAGVQTPGADGFEILKSLTGDFTVGAYTIIPLHDPNATSYFDSTGGAPMTVSYRIRATAGTQSNPQSVKGVESGTVKVTSLDATNTGATPTTSFDT